MSSPKSFLLALLLVLFPFLTYSFGEVPIDYTRIGELFGSRRKLGFVSFQTNLIRRHNENGFPDISVEAKILLIDFVLARAQTDPQTIVQYDEAAAVAAIPLEHAEAYIKYLLGKKFMDARVVGELVNFSFSSAGGARGYSRIDGVERIRNQLIEDDEDLSYLTIEDMIDWIEFFAFPSRQLTAPKTIVSNISDDANMRVMPYSWWVELMNKIRADLDRIIHPIVVTQENEEEKEEVEDYDDNDSDIVSITDDEFDAMMPGVAIEDDMEAVDILASLYQRPTGPGTIAFLNSDDGQETRRAIIENFFPIDNTSTKAAKGQKRKISSIDNDSATGGSSSSAVAASGARKSSPSGKRTGSSRQKVPLLRENRLSNGEVLIPVRIVPNQPSPRQLPSIPSENLIDSLSTDRSSRQMLPPATFRNIPKLGGYKEGQIIIECLKSQTTILTESLAQKILQKVGSDVDPNDAIDYAKYILSLRYIDWELYKLLVEYNAETDVVAALKTPEQIIQQLKDDEGQQLGDNHKAAALEYLHPEDVFIAYDMYVRINGLSVIPASLQMDILGSRLIAKFSSGGFLFRFRRAQQMAHYPEFLAELRGPGPRTDPDAAAGNTVVSPLPTIPVVHRQPVAGDTSRSEPRPAQVDNSPQQVELETQMVHHILSTDMVGRNFAMEWSNIIDDISNILAYRSYEVLGHAPILDRPTIEGIVLTKTSIREQTTRDAIKSMAPVFMSHSHDIRINSMPVGLLFTYQTILSRMNHSRFLPVLTFRKCVTTFRLILQLIALPDNVWQFLNQNEQLKSVDWISNYEEGIRLFRQTDWCKSNCPSTQVTDLQIIFWSRYIQGGIGAHVPLHRFANYRVTINMSEGLFLAAQLLLELADTSLTIGL